MIAILAFIYASIDAQAEARVYKWAAKSKSFAVCQQGPDCDDKWKKATDWVRSNTRFKIVVDQPDIFSTPGAIYANTDLSFTLARTQRADGKFDLKVYAWCGNVISCMPKPRTAIEQLKIAVEQP